MPSLNNNQVEHLLDMLQTVTEIALNYHRAELPIRHKADHSPVTLADITISQYLEKSLPALLDYPVLSEENTPLSSAWLDWQTYWLIDPIDGTRHFVNKTGDFCICIALIHRNQSVIGAICAPTENTTWFAQRADGDILKYQNGKYLPLSPGSPEKMTIALSADHLSPKMQKLLSVLPEYRWYQRGSALKYIDIIEGKANLYPKMWQTCEWDSAAGQCLIECASGQVIRLDDGKPMRYGQKKSLLNPHFLAHRLLGSNQIGQLLGSYRSIDSAYFSQM